MLCSAVSDPFDGPNYRLFAVLHQAILCPFLCKLFSVLFSRSNQIQLDVKIITNNSQALYKEYDNQTIGVPSAGVQTGTAARIDDQIMTTKID